MADSYKALIKKEFHKFFNNHMTEIKKTYQTLDDLCFDEIDKKFNIYVSELRRSIDKVSSRYNVTNKEVENEISYWEGAFYKGKLDYLFLE